MKAVAFEVRRKLGVWDSFPELDLQHQERGAWEQLVPSSAISIGGIYYFLWF